MNRYDCAEISKYWTLQSQFETYLEVELAILKTRFPELVDAFQHVQINISRIDEIEQTTKHDMIAFCTSITEQVSPDIGKYFHFGVTSSDIIDTSMNLRIKRSLKVILEWLQNVIHVLKELSVQHENNLIMGRSHGMYAEPMNLGKKFMGYQVEFERRYKDLHQFYEEECTAQFSGSVGNYVWITHEMEKMASQQLGLVVEPVSTQVIPRDHVAKLISYHALLGKAIERIATEIRHLHRNEVNEVSESFSSGQKGSSIMPHKKNPVASENLCGISRILESHVSIAMNNIPLWHERDISHSSTERLYLPENLILVGYALKKLHNVLSGLYVHVEQMEQRVKSEFQYLSSYYLHYILLHSTLNREEAYAVVQKASFEATSSADFVNRIRERIDITIPILTFDEIKNMYGCK
jgi:adenylosuccinate lyase